MWRTAKWARTKADQGLQPPSMPNIRDHNGTPQKDNQGKANAFAGVLFPPPVQADLPDIPSLPVPPAIQIDQVVAEEQISTILQQLPPDKAPGPDGIVNRVLTKCRHTVAPHLSRLFTACMAIGYIPPIYKHANTVVLKKPGKPDYSQPKAYRPIALLNTIGKALEKVVADRIS